MKKIIFVITIWLLIGKSYSQTSAAQQLAQLFADRMRDSLQLTEQQRNAIFTTNMLLHSQKQAIRREYSDTDSLQIKTQKVESMRDSLYKKILQPDQYQRYKERKRFIIRNR